MDFSKLSQHLVTRRFVMGDDGYEVTWDANRYSGSLWRRMAETYKTQAELVTKGLEASVTGQAKKKKVRGKQPKQLEAVTHAFTEQMEREAALSDLDRVVYADALASDRYGILRAWGITREGKPVEPTFSELMQVPGAALRDLFVFCRTESNPVPEKKMMDSTQETPQTTNDGSLTPITRSPESLTT